MIQTLPYSNFSSSAATVGGIPREQQAELALAGSQQQLSTLRSNQSLEWNQSFGGTKNNQTRKTPNADERRFNSAERLNLDALITQIADEKELNQSQRLEDFSSPLVRATPNNPAYRLYRVYDRKAEPQLLSLINADRSGNYVNILV